MITSAELLDQTRPIIAEMVDREEHRSGSRMVAYEYVAGAVGVTASWVRKLLGRQGGLLMEAHEYLNIVTAYRSLCERIEEEAETERRRAAALRGTMDAALESTMGVVARSPGSDRG